MARKNTRRQKSGFSFSAIIFFFLLFFGFLALPGCKNSSQEYTRGIGIYPGNSDEDFSPAVSFDDKTYRNIALHRPAFHSSSYDYNLTAQLVTDGIVDTVFPKWYSASSSQHGIM